MAEVTGHNFLGLPDCPRCGYELHGLPVPASPQPEDTGQCPECGLVFSWTALLDPLFSAPKWFIELDKGGLVANSIKTTANSLLPWKFWRLVQMELPRRPDRVVYALVLGLIWLWITFAVVNIVVTLGFESMSSPMPGGGTQSISSPLANHVLQNLWQLVSPENLGMFGAPWLNATYIAYICVPFSMMLLPHTLKRAKVLPGHVVRIAVYSVTPILVIAAIPPTICATWWMVDVGIRGNFYSSGGDYFVQENNHWMRPSLTFLAIVLTWGFAFSRYLKLPRAWLVAGLLAVLSTLLGVLFTVLTTSPYYLF